MASTNKTTNYELSQYVGSDKPTYLGDYNSDMLKIDTQMKANATAAETADGKATTAGTNAATALENAATADGKAVTAGETATSALNKALANETAIASLENANKYLETETVIGVWIDKPLYRKVISIGSMPNNTSKLVAHGISNLKRVINAYGYFYRSTDNMCRNFNFAFDGSTAAGIEVGTTNIEVAANWNTQATEAYVVLEYTKLTD